MLIPKTWPALGDALEVGARIGVNRAYKHTDTPTREQIAEAVVEAQLAEIEMRFHVREAADGVGE